MKTLILDIETAPSLAYVWSFWKQNIGHDMVEDYGGYIMSCALKWLGDTEVVYLENREDNDKRIVEDICKYLDKADFVIAHNGKKFDIPFIKSRAAINGINPPSPVKIIDTLIIAKKEMAFKRNTLQFLAEALQVDKQKYEHSNFNGFKLWKSCMEQDDEAWLEMKKYNILDVEVLEEVYYKLRPWYTQHPNVTTDTVKDKPLCPKCGSSHVRKYGWYYTNKGKYQKWKCESCGGYSSETYTKNTREERQSLLASR